MQPVTCVCKQKVLDPTYTLTLLLYHRFLLLKHFTVVLTVCLQPLWTGYAGSRVDCTTTRNMSVFSKENRQTSKSKIDLYVKVATACLHEEASPRVLGGSLVLTEAPGVAI